MRPKKVIGLKEWQATFGTNRQKEAGKKFDWENRIELVDKKTGKTIILSPLMELKMVEKIAGTQWNIAVENLQSVSTPNYRFVLYHKGGKNDRSLFSAVSNYYLIPHSAYCGLGEIKSWATLSGIRKWVKAHISVLQSN